MRNYEKNIVAIGLCAVLGVGVAADDSSIKIDNLIKEVKKKQSNITKEIKTNVLNKDKKLTPGFNYPLANPQTNRIMVKVTSDFDEKKLIDTIASKNMVSLNKVREFRLRKPGISVKSSPRMMVIEVSDINKLETIVEQVKNIDGVLNAEIDHIITANMLPNDPEYPNLWGIQKISAETAWNASIGSNNVIVGVIDTGVDYYHPDLQNNIWTNDAELNGEPGVDDDGNGYVDDIHGIDTINYDSDPFDDNGHGTHVSGTIAGVGNNGEGVVGVNWNAKIVACKFLSAEGWGYTSGAIECVNYINTLKNSGQNIVAVNNSWGGGDYSQDLYDAFNIAKDLNIIHVCAAGNSSNNNDLTPSYPASYDLENIIAVASVDSYDNLSYFSNYGSTSVDLAAPGEYILSTLPSIMVCKATNDILGVGFETEASISNWSFLTIDSNYPFQDLPDLHWSRTDIEGFNSIWSLTDSPNGNYQDNKIQSAVTGSYDLSAYTNSECVGLRMKIKGENESYFDGFYVFLSGDDGTNWSYYFGTDQTYNEWTGIGELVIDPSLLTNSFRIALVRSNDCCVNFDGYMVDNLIIYEGYTDRVGNYGSYSGTSMATPHVTGAIALAASIYTDENLTQRVSRILNGVDYVSSLEGLVATAGRLNVAKVLNGENSIQGDDFNVTRNHNWERANFVYYDGNIAPVVIAGPLSFKGAQGAVVRIKDVNTTGADIRVQEWNYLDGAHINEDISVLVVKPGRYLMNDGNVIEVGTFEISGTTNWYDITFNQPFADVPYLFLTIQTFNGPDTVVVRAKDVTTTGFKARLFEQQSLMGSPHAKEVVGYIAVYAPNGEGVLFADSNDPIYYYLTKVQVNNEWTNTPYGYQIMVQEEQSADSEVNHLYENIDVMYFNSKLFAQDVSTLGLDPAALRMK